MRASFFVQNFKDKCYNGDPRLRGDDNVKKVPAKPGPFAFNTGTTYAKLYKSVMSSLFLSYIQNWFT